VDSKKIPKHIVIIPDGNRRWALKRACLPEKGHRQGADSIIDTVKAARELGVKAITFYLFSTENWERPQSEINALMALLKEMLRSKCPEMVSLGIRLQTIGELSAFPQDVLEVIEETKRATADCKTIDMIYALNYGGRNEICRACQKIAQQVDENSTISARKFLGKGSESTDSRSPMQATLQGLLKQDDEEGVDPQPFSPRNFSAGIVDENTLSQNLDTAHWPDPDLFIRTGGVKRLSNFLLWQLSYTELFFTDLLWPDFTPLSFLEAIQEYQRRERRYGR
jgi:undecaprenyl diphosphate synthase